MRVRSIRVSAEGFSFNIGIGSGVHSEMVRGTGDESEKL